MIIAVLIVLGLCFGSFVNALVWRVHEQAERGSKKKADKKYLQELSISKGRSMCPHCHHTLAAKDLLPVLSWLSVGGKCRYCRKPISWQYPVVELLTAALFVLSYVYWPTAVSGRYVLDFGCWLALLTGFMALFVYDTRWMLLPNRIIYPLSGVAALDVLARLVVGPKPLLVLWHTFGGVVLGGGIFWLIYQFSKGKWIGGGDVRLGWLFGAVVGSASGSIMVIFIASLLGSVLAIPLLFSKKLHTNSLIPFGPLLIVATVIVKLFGARILAWYMHIAFIS